MDVIKVEMPPCCRLRQRYPLCDKWMSEFISATANPIDLTGFLQGCQAQSAAQHQI